MRVLSSSLALLLILGIPVASFAQLSLFQSDDAANRSNPDWLVADPLDLGSKVVHEAVDLFATEQQVEGEEQAKSLEDMLHWAISNSDPDKLRQEAEELHTQNAVHDLLQAREKVKELHEYLKQQPTEAELLTEAIGILKDAASSHELQLIALSRLQELVEPIDNANDLKTLDGITPVVNFIDLGKPDLAAAACYVVGTAASNNPTFQQHLFEAYPQIFEQLLGVVQKDSADAAGKCLYAISNLVRNTATLRNSFLQVGGLQALSGVFSKNGAEARLKRKALDLFADLVQLEPGDTSKFMASASGGSITQALLSLVLQNDLDLQEKALIALRVLAASQQNRQVLSSHGALAVLETLSSRLAKQAQMNSDDQYFEYVSGLCDAVLATFRSDQRLEL